MKTAKICHLTSVHPRYDTRIFFKECKTLSNAGFEVNLIVADGKGNEVVDKIKIYDVGKPINRKERMLKTTRKVFKKALEVNAEIYHFHDPELIPIGIKLKKLGKKVIYDVHEDVPEQILSKDYIPKFFRIVLALSFNFLEKNFSKFFDYIVTSTDFIKNKFVKYNTNVIDIKNYVSIEYAKTTNTKKKQEQTEFVLVFAGGIYKERNILEGIKACNILKELPIRFVLYGKIEPNYLYEIKKIDTLGRLDYRGELPYEKVLMELAEADIGFICDYPKKRHAMGLPVKLFEYMAVGIPVIASNFPLWKEIIEKNNCGICVDPTNPEEIAKAIEYLITHPDEARKMGENGRKAVLEKFNWEEENEKLINIYKSLG
jgi:glycosyltransferase involved in cell wall biosynthesis